MVSKMACLRTLITLFNVSISTIMQLNAISYLAKKLCAYHKDAQYCTIIHFDSCIRIGLCDYRNIYIYTK